MESMKEICVGINGMGHMKTIQLNRSLSDTLPSGKTLVVTCGEDGAITFTDLDAEKEIFQKVLSDSSIPAVAITPEQSHMLLVLEDEETMLNTLYYYSMPPSCTMEKALYRSTVAIRHIACSTKYIAIADEESTVKVLLRSDTSKVISINGHESGILSVTIDPSEKYIVSSSEDGSVRVFDLNETSLSANQVAMYKILFQDLRNEMVFCRCAWQESEAKKPTLLAVPITNSIIELIDPVKEWKSSGQLLLPTTEGVVSGDINIVAFSPNGTYLAAATVNKQIFIWNVKSKIIIRTFQVSHELLAVEWAPNQNAIIAYHTGAKFAFVKDVIPSSSTLPFGYNQSTISTSNGAAHSSTSAKNTTKSLVKESFIEDEAIDDGANHSSTSDDEEEYQHVAPSGSTDVEENRLDVIKASFGFGQPNDLLSYTKDNLPQDAVSASTLSNTPLFFPEQKPFQSAELKDTSSSTQLLAWTTIGEIEVVQDVGNTSENIIKVEFIDKSRRGFKFTDMYKFTMAVLDDSGAFFACPRRVREEWEPTNSTSDDDDMNVHPSMLFYRPFESWVTQGSWHKALPLGEDAEAIAATSSFVAVGTSLQLVRVYTTSGLEYTTFRLPGRIVTMSGKNSRLAIVYQSRNNTIHYQLLTINSMRTSERLSMICTGELPLTPPPRDVFVTEKENMEVQRNFATHSTLTWLNFDETGHMLYSVDSFACVSVLCGSNGWQWYPIGCVGNMLSKPASERSCIFPLGVVQSALLYIPVEIGRKFPKLRGKHRPLPRQFHLQRASFPHSSGGASNNSNNEQTNHIWQNLRIGEYTREGSMGSIHVDIVKEQAAVDKALLLQMKAACTDDQALQVLDLAKDLHLAKSHQIAKTLATHYGLKQLQNELYHVYQQKFEQPAAITQSLELPSNQSIRHTFQSPTPAKTVDSPLQAAVRNNPSSILMRTRTLKRKANSEDEDGQHEQSESTEETDAKENRDTKIETIASPPPEVDTSIAPVNPFLRGGANGKSIESGKSSGGLSRLAQMTSPPPKKQKISWR